MIFSTVKFTIQIDILRWTHLVTFEVRCLGFPKRSYFFNFVKMVTRGEVLKNALRLSLLLAFSDF